MLKVGLTGGIATGKSTVADVLRQMGCEIVDADRLGHAAIEPTGPAYDAIVNAFGHEIVANCGPDTGRIVRSRLAAIVFGDPARLAQLNTIVHPAIVELIEKRAATFAREKPCGILVVDAALLLEAGWKGSVDKVVVVDCSVEQQIARFVARGLGDAEEARRRIDAQWPREAKLAHADFVIDSSGTIEETEQCARALYEGLSKIV